MLHPIKALDHVIDSYRDYLVTEFRARDERLQDELQDALTRENFLAREPFFSAHTAFESGKAWEALGLDNRLAAALRKRAGGNASYLHQSLAIEHLLSGSENPLVISTGTGSGKTESFLAPVLHTAIEDAIATKNRAGMVAILLYPMNALANDQLERIKWYLRESGWDGTVRVEQYNRGTSQEDREKMRENPPHILLTNYQMLEYLLVRPADREALFKGHRMRFIVLDEVHTYGGTLGTHVALLVRRLKAHLKRANAKQQPVFVGASATIAENGIDGSRRDESIQNFFGRLVGEEASSIHVVSEAKVKVEVPSEAQYAAEFRLNRDYDLDDPEDLRQAIVALTGVSLNTSLEVAIWRCRLLWDLNRWLAKGAQPVSALVEFVRQEIPERMNWPKDHIHTEIELGLRVGAAVAALNNKTENALRLRAHRFVRGGWQFYRCLNPECGMLHPRGESQCTNCGSPTAPLYLCRICGADYLRLRGSSDGAGQMQPYPEVFNVQAQDHDHQHSEWLLYHHSDWSKVDFEEEDLDDELDDEVGVKTARPGKLEPIQGHWDVGAMNFIPTKQGKSHIFPSRRRCPHCGSRGWPRYVITPVSLGTSAALKVLTEGIIEALPGEDKKRVLIFADSRQDAAHQARYINFAARYDRMRSRVFRILRDADQPITLNALVEKLGQLASEAGDNPYLKRLPNGKYVIPRGTEEREVYLAWEEAPLLDNLALNTRYRAALENLGLIAVNYAYLDEFVASQSDALAHGLGVAPQYVGYVVHQILDIVRKRGALSRTLLQYHPDGLTKQQILRGAEWERGVGSPIGLPAAADGGISLRADAELPPGVRLQPIWSSKGQSTAIQQMAEHLAERLVGLSPTADGLLGLMQALVEWQFLKLVDLYGYRGRPIHLYQLNDGIVELSKADNATRYRCNICGRVTYIPEWVQLTGDIPCPHCRKGYLYSWLESDVLNSRYVTQAVSDVSIPLKAAEHTAQVPSARRSEIETEFKSPEAALNVLACSPTLELGIHVGGLEAVALRNIPPRPDNYAQRGGRAGRDERVGLVVGYTRNTPHDQYFFQHPQEMIAGAVPAPAFNLGNRDAIARHLNAIAFGLSDPGIAGKMKEYVTFRGEIVEEKLVELLNGLRAAKEATLAIAEDAFPVEILLQAGYTPEALAHLIDELPQRVTEAIQRTALQVRRLFDTIENWTELGGAGNPAKRAGQIINNLLGIEDGSQTENMDVGSAYPLRRLAESGILPGYEFPVEPSTLRLLSDKDEWSTLSTARPSGLHQYQPGAPVYARGRRWKVVGLDLSSPWNPQGKEPTWNYLRCDHCDLAYNPQTSPRCPRCNEPTVGKPTPAFDYAGFIARPDDSTVSDEEDRVFSRNLVEIHPSWQTESEQPIAGRWGLSDGWLLERRRGESVVWLNEGIPDISGIKIGYRLCPDCGKVISQPVEDKKGGKGRKAPAGGARDSLLGHSENCPRKRQPLPSASLYAGAKVETLRLLFIWPGNPEDRDETNGLDRWALTLGYALLAGAERHFALASGDLDMLWEGLRKRQFGGQTYNEGIITFIDPNVGGSGYLEKMAEDFHQVAAATLHHLDHDDCESACYRCLKSYTNQRFHDRLHWPSVISTLQGLVDVKPDSLNLGAADIRDPNPWLEAHKAGCDSPLEHNFLKLIENAGIQVEKQYAIPENQPFTIADFAIPDRRIAIYVDGLAFHTSDRLRRDKAIERRLNTLQSAWQVLRITASDLRRHDVIENVIKTLS